MPKMDERLVELRRQFKEMQERLDALENETKSHPGQKSVDGSPKGVPKKQRKKMG